MITSPLWWLTLALTVPLYRAGPAALRAPLLALASATFLATIAPELVLALSLWSAASFVLLGRARRWAAPVFFLGLAGQLAVFKYLPPAWLGVERLLVPLGLSFFTFKLLHYGIERVRGTLPEHSLADLLSWVFLFPIFTAGPIERFDHHLAHRALGPWQEDLAHGLTRITHGLIKKLVVAELLLGPRILEPTALLAELETLSPWDVQSQLALSFLWLYMDFSGYCDVAIGACRLFGVRVTENFSWPLLAQNVSDFWRRWHISLSQWCQAYVYLPLIGLSRSPTVAALGTFLVMGLWHAGSWHWVAWGLWHATGVIVNMRWQRLKRRRRWARVDAGPLRYAGVPLTLAWVCGAHAFTLLHGHGGLWSSVRLLGRGLGLDIPEWS